MLIDRRGVAEMGEADGGGKNLAVIGCMDADGILKCEHGRCRHGRLCDDGAQPPEACDGTARGGEKQIRGFRGFIWTPWASS